MSERRADQPNNPVAGPEFLKIFLPYELRLAQRRAMVTSSRSPDRSPGNCLGLYCVRLEPITGDWFPAPLEGGAQISAHIQTLLQDVIRDSDIPIRLSDQEHLAVLRDLDPEHTYVVSQRFLAMAADSDLLLAANLRARVGYVVYPLSSQPNFPAEQWATVVDLARKMSDRAQPSGPACGHGLLQGPAMAESGIPESDLIPLALRDPDALVKVGLLRIQRVHLMPNV
jgi:hypothetical protein